jgi:hypothetical protein
MFSGPFDQSIISRAKKKSLIEINLHDQTYFNIAWADVEEWLAEEHCGDCTGLPSPCPRCYAEDIVHKAKWITERLLNPTI